MTRHHTVPVDDRWLGMDKRGIPYAAVALALIGVLIWVLPSIDNGTGWDNPTVAGDVIDLGEGATIVPPVGWQLESGYLITDEPINPVSPDAAGAGAIVSNGAATVTVATSRWDGTANELMDQYTQIREVSDEDADQVFAVTGPPQSVTTAGGVTGVETAYTSAGGDGRTFAFVVPSESRDTIGVVISATSSDATLGQTNAQVDALVSSLTATENAS